MKKARRFLDAIKTKERKKKEKKVHTYVKVCGYATTITITIDENHEFLPFALAAIRRYFARRN